MPKPKISPDYVSTGSTATGRWLKLAPAEPRREIWLWTDADTSAPSYWSGPGPDGETPTADPTVAPVATNRSIPDTSSLGGFVHLKTQSEIWVWHTSNAKQVRAFSFFD